LFERESVQRHSKKSGAAGQEAASDVEGRVGAGCWWDGGNTSDTLTKCGANGAQRMPDKDNFGAVLQPFDRQTQGSYGVGNVASTCAARDFKSATDLVAVPYTKSKRAQSETDDETWVEGQVNPTLSLFDCGDVRATTVAIQGNLIGRDKGGPQGVGASTEGAMYTMTKADVHGVAVDTLHQQGYNANYASTEEANAVETLRVLQQEIGEEAFTAWGFGILDSLQPTKVLRSRLHGAGIRCATFSRSWAVYCAISREKNRAAGALQSVQEAEGKGCSPSGRELPEQLAEQLGAYLSQLSQPGTQFERLMHHLRCACKGVGILRQALSAIQETQRPVDVEGQTPTVMMVRRLTPIECEFLQGFPRDYTLIPWRKKAADDCPDGPRYKALGNSMAVNCMEWIGERIAAVEAEKETT
jgi:DNA (cytosine-5)-methyltransferase 1